jgi:uncharacterized membrane protein
MSMVQQAVEVGAPLHTVYEQLTAFENYPRFMTGVERVTPLGNHQTHWVMQVDGHRREFDAQITELSFDQRVSWATVDGPLLAETLTVRPMGETRTQVVAQLEADIAFLMPSDRHGQATLNRRLKDDLTTFKSLVERVHDRAAPPTGRHAGAVRGGPVGAEGHSGTARMGGRTRAADPWGDGMMNEDDRGSAHDF